jgi:AAA15 family ATPase/GTPase
MFSKDAKRQYNEKINDYYGKLSEIEYLTIRLEQEKEKLNELKKDKRREKENTKFISKKLNNSELIQNLKKELDMYYDLAYNIDEYYKNFEKGNLDDALTYYSNEDREVAKEFIEEKGPMIIRKKKGNTL